MNAVMRLFKAVEVKTNSRETVSKEILAETVKKGFVFAPEIIANYSESELRAMITPISSMVGLSAEQMNSSLHKSWDKVATAPILQLIIEQLHHYVTVYGFAEAGFYSDDTIYIPNEKLNVPDIGEGSVILTVIKGYDRNQLKEKVLKLLESGVAMKEQTVKDVAEIAVSSGIEPKDLATIKNKEASILLHTSMGMVPSNPTEFLRYIIHRVTDSTLLIKNIAVITAMKGADSDEIFQLFVQYGSENGIQKLAAIFNRFKPLFLAMKQRKMVPVINRISKLSKKFHKPLPADLLNDITAMISRDESIDISAFLTALSEANTFRKVRLAYALKFRLSNPGSVTYRIRNGKAFSTKFSFTGSKQVTEAVFEYVIKSITNDVSKNLEGKKVYLPGNMSYALPATEKQFTGNFPSGSYVSITDNMVAGVHWFNLENDIVDLDLSAISVDGKFGWDGSYRSEEGGVLFSGDITSAPKPQGASELFYIKSQSRKSLLLMVNHYNRYNDEAVPFKIFVGRSPGTTKKEYMIDPNDATCIAKTEMTQKSKMLGLILADETGSRFYFAEAEIGRSITSSDNDYIEHARNYLLNYYENMISLNEIIQKFGAEIVTEPAEADIDLSPAALEKDTIINLLSL